MQLPTNCSQYCGTDNQKHVRLCVAKRRIFKIRVQAFSKLDIIVPVKSVDINEMGSSYAISIVNEVILAIIQYAGVILAMVNQL